MIRSMETKTPVKLEAERLAKVYREQGRNAAQQAFNEACKTLKSFEAQVLLRTFQAEIWK